VIKIQLIPPTNMRNIFDLPMNIQDDLFRGLEDIMLDMRADIQNYFLSGPWPAVLQPDTGKLKSGVTSKTVRVGRRDNDIWAYGEVGNSVKLYNKIHEYGKVIQAAEGEHSRLSDRKTLGPYLHFFWKRRGIWLRVKQVRIPARPYMKPGVQMSVLRIRSVLGRIIWGAYVRTIAGTP
jgi:hypothetical protein